MLDSVCDNRSVKVKWFVTVPSPSVLFSKSCLACSLEMRLLPSRNSRNFCGELRVITRRPRVPARAPALKTAICDKKAKGKGHAESLFKAFIRACPSSDCNRIAVSLTKWKYLGRDTPLSADQRLQKGAWCVRFRVLHAQIKHFKVQIKVLSSYSKFHFFFCSSY